MKQRSHAAAQPEPQPDQVQRNIETVARLEQVAQAPRSVVETMTDRIAQFIGSLPFVYLHILWFSVWVLFNTGSRRHPAFDPFPFNLLGLLLSMEAIFLTTFVLIGQNRQQRLADRRDHLELQINILAEQEATKMLQMLEAIQQRLGMGDHDPEIEALKQAVQPERLMEQIEVEVERLEQQPNPPPTASGGPGGAA